MQTQILTVSQLAQAIPALSEQSIRWQLFNREKNGLAESGAILKVGRRVLIDLPIYLAWMREQG